MVRASTACCSPAVALSHNRAVRSGNCNHLGAQRQVPHSLPHAALICRSGPEGDKLPHWGAGCSSKPGTLKGHSTRSQARISVPRAQRVMARTARQRPLDSKADTGF